VVDTSVTICIAAICENTTIVAMSDRLLTSGVHQYQPAKPKIYPITQSIVALLSSDDLALAAELIQEVKDKVDAGIKANPNAWWSVRDAGNIWRDVYLERRGRDAETAILIPLGLTRDSFVSRNNQLAPSLVDRISNELINYDIANTDVIFAGTDGSGPHLYVARNASVKCNDAIGYAAVGSGAHHARSQFITSSHAPNAPVNRTVFVAYTAKRRAESAPGVGRDTDTFYTWAAGYGSTIREDILDLLKKTYEKMEADSAKTLEKSLGKVHDEITKIVAAPKQPDQQQVPKDENPTTPPDDKKAGGEGAGEETGHTG
jgi:hypothetical protein